jgi:hypothetical protein
MTFIYDLVETPSVPVAPGLAVSDKVIKAYSMRRYGEWDQDKITSASSYEICEYGYTADIGAKYKTGYMTGMDHHVADDYLEGPHAEQMREFQESMKINNAKAWMFGVVSRGITTICRKEELMSFFGDVRSLARTGKGKGTGVDMQVMHDLTLEAVVLAVDKYAEALETGMCDKPLYMTETKRKVLTLGGYYNTVSETTPVLPEMMSMEEFVSVMHEVYKRLPDPTYSFPSAVPSTAAELRIMMATVMEKMAGFCKNWNSCNVPSANAVNAVPASVGGKRIRE